MLMPLERSSGNRTLTVRIGKIFRSPEREFSLDAEFTAEPGFTILFGASGSGKTTLLDCVAGVATPETVRITVGERVLFETNSRINVPVAKRGVGYVLQELALFPHLTVEQNTEYGLAHLPRPERKQRASAMLQEFPIDQLKRHPPATISGGERHPSPLPHPLLPTPPPLPPDDPPPP